MYKSRKCQAIYTYVFICLNNHLKTVILYYLMVVLPVVESPMKINVEFEENVQCKNCAIPSNYINKYDWRKFNKMSLKYLPFSPTVDIQQITLQELVL